MTDAAAPRKKRKSGIPTGNAGEYLVMGELLRRGFSAQLADRNTQGYDILLGVAGGLTMHTVQVKTVRQQPWFIKVSDFAGPRCDQSTIYVLLGDEQAKAPVRFFIARNRDLLGAFHHPDDWKAQGRDSGFMKLKMLEPYEGKWESLFA
jgi:hypothetical protein